MSSEIIVLGIGLALSIGANVYCLVRINSIKTTRYITVEKLEDGTTILKENGVKIFEL